MPIRYRLLIWLIVKAIESRDYTWLLAKAVRYITLNIRVNHEEKRWEISSGAAFDPSWQKIDFSDIEEIFKSKVSSYHVEEKRVDGKFVSFTVSTY